MSRDHQAERRFVSPDMDSLLIMRSVFRYSFSAPKTLWHHCRWGGRSPPSGGRAFASTGLTAKRPRAAGCGLPAGGRTKRNAASIGTGAAPDRAGTAGGASSASSALGSDLLPGANDRATLGRGLGSEVLLRDASGRDPAVASSVSPESATGTIILLPGRWARIQGRALRMSADNAAVLDADGMSWGAHSPAGFPVAARNNRGTGGPLVVRHIAGVTVVNMGRGRRRRNDPWLRPRFLGNE